MTLCRIFVSLDSVPGKTTPWIEAATAYEDIPLICAITGQAGRRFWEKLGFSTVESGIETALEEEDDFVKQMREQAAAQGLDLQKIKNKYTMRLELS